MVVTAVFRRIGCGHRGREEQRGQGTRRGGGGGGGEEGRSVGPGAGMDVCECQDPPEGLERGTCDHLFVPREDTQGPRSHVPAHSALPPPAPAPDTPLRPPSLPSQLQASRQKDSQPSLCRLSLPPPPPVGLADSFGKSGGRQISLMLRSPAGFRRCLIWLSPR